MIAYRLALESVGMLFKYAKWRMAIRHIDSKIIKDRGIYNNIEEQLNEAASKENI